MPGRQCSGTPGVRLGGLKGLLAVLGRLTCVASATWLRERSPLKLVSPAPDDILQASHQLALFAKQAQGKCKMQHHCFQGAPHSLTHHYRSPNRAPAVAGSGAPTGQAAPPPDTAKLAHVQTNHRKSSTGLARVKGRGERNGDVLWMYRA